MTIALVHQLQGGQSGRFRFRGTAMPPEGRERQLGAQASFASGVFFRRLRNAV